MAADSAKPKKSKQFDVDEDELPQVDEEPEKLKTPPVVRQPAGSYGSLVYFAYPGFEVKLTPWSAPLSEALRGSGYITYDGAAMASEQFAESDVPLLESLKSRAIEPVCSMLRLPMELSQPLHHKVVSQKMKHGDMDPRGEDALFRHLWFLARSSVVIADLTAGAYTFGFCNLLVYAKLLHIPVIAVAPIGIPTDVWLQSNVSVLLTDQFNIANVLPLIRGYCC